MNLFLKINITMPPKKNPYSNLKSGAFTKQAKDAGMSLPKFAEHVIKNYKNSDVPNSTKT